MGRTYIFYAQPSDVAGAAVSEDYSIERFTSEGDVDAGFSTLSFPHSSFTYCNIVSDHTSGNVFAVFSDDAEMKKIKVATLHENGGAFKSAEMALSLENQLVGIAVCNNVFVLVTGSSSPKLALYEYMRDDQPIALKLLFCEIIKLFME